jgi:hypothetical protein
MLIRLIQTILFIQILIVSLAITYCNAGNIAGPAILGDAPAVDATGYGLGLGLGYGLNYGYAGDLGLATGLGKGYAGGLGLATGYAGKGLGLGVTTGVINAPIGPVSAAIQSRRTYEVVPSPLPQEPAVPQIIEVEPSIQPVQVLFRSISSPVVVQQAHTPGAPGQVESTRSEDEPHRVTHEVLRPVIQEVREVIQPYRRVVQEVRPVLEEVHTVVAKGHRDTAIAAPAPVLAAAPVAAPVLADAGFAGYAGGYGLAGGLGNAGGYGFAGGLGKGGKGLLAGKAAKSA